MGNLFIVFTPLQLFVAQQIIRQEKLENNIIIEGYRSSFSRSYDMMRIEDLWSKRLEIEEIALWDGNNVTSLVDIETSWKNYRRLKDIIKSNNVSTLYLGEVLNKSCRFAAVVFSHLGCKISFFEEGTSHYINRPYDGLRTFKKRLHEFLIDYFYYLPLYGVRFAKWYCTPNRPYDDLPMDERFSIIPFHNKLYDKRLYIEPMFTATLREYVESNIPVSIDEKRVMLMTDPLRELMKQEDLYLYFDTIKECIENIPTDTTLYIKFHPREIDSSRKKILNIAKQSGIDYKVLSEEVNICVEYYLQLFKFEKIYFFNAATYFYNGYAFPKTEFVKLMPVVYKKAKDAGVENLVYMENMLKMIEPYNYKND